MITISVCMIIKNEAKVLKRCLDSIKDIVDEIIIVDTGSTDNSVEIALSYTDNVHHFKWIDDFSAARNYSFSFATKDYIYCADADEFLDEINRNKFLELKENLEKDTDIVQMYYKNQLSYNTVYNFDRELRPKLYRRSRNFLFEGPVHEAVPVTDDLKVITCEIDITHMPQSLHSSRDFSIFLKHYASGGRIPDRLHTQYARELFICGEKADFLDAEKVFLESVNDTTRDTNQFKEACCVLSHIAILTHNTDMLLKYGLKLIATEGCSEICYDLGEYYYGKEDYNEAAIWYYNAAFEASPILNIHYGTDYPLKALAKTYRTLGLTELAEEYENYKI